MTVALEMRVAVTGREQAAQDFAQTKAAAVDATKGIAMASASASRSQDALTQTTGRTRQAFESVAPATARQRNELGRLVGSATAAAAAQDNLTASTRAQIGAMDGLQRGVSGLRTLYGSLAAVAGGMLVKSFIDAGSEVEDLTIQFKVLLGDVETAQARIKEYSEFGASTPFELGEVARAGRVLQVFGGDVLATGENLKMVGDIAAGTNTPFQDTAMWIGRMYDALQSGRPWGEAGMRLQEMGALSGAARARLESMQEAGESGMAIWAAFGTEMERFNGMMEDLSGTRSGQWSTTMDYLKTGMREILDGGLWDGLNQGLGDFNALIRNLIDSGALRELGLFMTSLAQTAQGALLGALGGIGAIVHGVLIYPLTNAIDVVLGMTQMLLTGISGALKSLPQAIVPDGWVQSLAQANQSVLGVRMSVADFQQTTNDLVAKAGTTAWELLTSKVEGAAAAIDTVNKKTKTGGAYTAAPSMTEKEAAEIDKMALAVEAANAKFREIKRKGIQEDIQLDEERTNLMYQARQRLAEASLPEGDELAALRLKHEEELSLYAEHSEARLIIERAHAQELSRLKHQQSAEFSAYSSAVKQMNAQMQASSFALAGSIAAAALQSRKSAPALFAVQKTIAAASIYMNYLAAEAAAFAPPPIGAGPMLGFGLALKLKSKMFADLGMLAGLSIAEGVQRFAGGGIADVGTARSGIVPGSANYGDTVPARLNSREMVLNMPQQARLFAIADGAAAPVSNSRVVNNYEIHYSPVNEAPRSWSAEPSWEQYRGMTERNKVEFGAMISDMIKRGYVALEGW